MRAQYPLITLLSAAALLAACETNTSPDLPAEESESTIRSVAPSPATVVAPGRVFKKPGPGPAPCLPGKC
jgi:hypothetical protein